MKKDFNDIVVKFQNEKIRLFVECALQKLPVGFWIDSSSTGGKHHAPEDNMKGGNVIHSRKVVKVALHLCDYFGVTDRLTVEKIIAACILHDSYKRGIPWGDKTDKEHGNVAADQLKKMEIAGYPSDDPDFNDITEMVRNHMSRFNKPLPTPALIVGKTFEEKDLHHVIVQIADYWASTEWCPFIADEIKF